jgi:parvulin-like peptidyl-prolyl isomerase
MNRITNFFIIFLVSVFLLIQCGLDSDSVATIGNSKITADEFRELLKNRFPGEKDFNNIDSKKKNDLLNQVIQKKLKVNAALDNDLDEDPEISKAINKQEENLLGQKYFEVVIVDQLISEKQIEEFIKRQGTELKVSYITIGYKKAHISKDRTKDEAMKIAQQVVEEANAGKDFNELAVQYSDDPSAKRNKGEFGYFRWGQKPKDFQETCWDLNVGEVSGIVETKEGLNVIRLDDRREDSSYVVKKDMETIFRTKKTLYGAVVDSGNKLWQKKIVELREESSFEYNEAKVNNVVFLINEKIKNSKIDTNSFSEEEQSEVLATWNDESISFGTIIQRYKDNLPRVMGAFRDPKKIKKEIENMSLLSMAMAKARDLDLHKDEHIIKQINQFKEDRLSYVAEQKLVNEKIDFNDDDVKTFYDQNPDQFMDPAKYELWAITVKDEALANKISKLAKKGSNFESLAKKYSTDKYYKDKGGYLGFRTINSRGSISKKAFEMKPNGEISEPVKYKKEWAIIKTGELNEKKLKPFQDVIKMVEGRLRNDLLKKKRIEWNEELKDKYTVKINEEVLNNL